MMLVEAATPLWTAAPALLNERGRDFSRRRDKVLETFDPEAIHDLRVASRRLREGLLLFAPCYPGDGLAWILKRLRKVTRLLGDIRNSDEAALFFATLLEELADACRADLSRLVAVFREKRAAELEQLEAGLQKLTSAKLRDRFRQVVDHPSLLAPMPGGVDPFIPLAEFAKEALDTRLDRVLQLVPDARLPENAAAQHRMRIAVKHYRYRLEILSTLIGSGYQELHAAVKGYQEVLGKMHDLDVFAGICRTAAFSPPAAELVPAAIAAKREQLFAAFAAMLKKLPFEQIGARVREGLHPEPFAAQLPRPKEPAMSKDKKPKKQDKKKDGENDKKKDVKRLCKWDKGDIEGELDKLKGIVVSARFICRRCGRVAKEAGYLCKPVAL